jgi:MFS family permease
MNTESSLHYLIRAFRSRNYRLFYAGQIVSLIGTWMSSIAMSWLVYRLTQSPLLLGAIGFASQFPTSLLSPWAGVHVDRINRHKVLVATQTVSMLQSFALALLTLTDQITVTHLLLLAAVQGLANAFDIPGRQAFLSEIVEDRRDLPNAIALNSAMFNAARLVGPAIGGVIISLTGEGICFLIDGFSYLAVITALLKMDVQSPPRAPRKTNITEDLKEGFSYVRTFAPVRSILSLVAITSLLGLSYVTLMPVYAKEILHGGPRMLGVLMGSSGLGALLGAVTLAMRRSVLGLGRVIAVAGMCLGLSICAFAFSSLPLLSMLMLFAAGFSTITMMAASNTVIQTLVDDSMRGRVMSYYAMAFTGMMPLGSLFGGWLALHIGAPLTAALGGVSCFFLALRFYTLLPRIRQQARPVLVERGILTSDSRYPES